MLIIASNTIVEPFLKKKLKRIIGQDDRVLFSSILLTDLLPIIDTLTCFDVVVLYNFYETDDNSVSNILDCFIREYNNLINICNRKIILVGLNYKLEELTYAIGNGYLNFELVDILDVSIARLLRPEDTYISIKNIISKIGVGNSISKKNKYRWNSIYSDCLWQEIANEIKKQLLICKGITKKCLVLDCDNVVWGGILSEDGIEGIRLGKNGFGRAYYDFQNFVYTLYKHGVILAICSKNDLTDVLQVFRNHSEMVLKEKHISCFMVNWESKPSNIKKIAEYLNIGLDSIVFVDDSSIEIEGVKTLLPEVTTIQFDKYMDYEPFSCFNLKPEYDSEDIEKRTQTYQANGLRNELKKTAKDYEDYVQSLNVVVDIHKAIPIEMGRISELTQRANKCTNGRRYTIEDLRAQIGNPNISLYSVSVSDRFSDLGLVGAMEVVNNHLTLFCLSCRALGRGVEQEMIGYILSKHQINSVEFQTTNKNGGLQDILTNVINGNLL